MEGWPNVSSLQSAKQNQPNKLVLSLFQRDRLPAEKEVKKVSESLLSWSWKSCAHFLTLRSQLTRTKCLLAETACYVTVCERSSYQLITQQMKRLFSCSVNSKHGDSVCLQWLVGNVVGRDDTLYARMKQRDLDGHDSMWEPIFVDDAAIGLGDQKNKVPHLPVLQMEK